MTVLRALAAVASWLHRSREQFIFSLVGACRSKALGLPERPDWPPRPVKAWRPAEKAEGYFQIVLIGWALAANPR